MYVPLCYCKVGHLFQKSYVSVYSTAYHTGVHAIIASPILVCNFPRTLRDYVDPVEQPE
jgi:hypothetical protein